MFRGCEKQNKKEDFIESIENKQVINYLRGDWPYTVEVSEWTSTIIRTDIQELLLKGVYPAYQEQLKINIQEIFESSLRDMIVQGNAYDLYVALFVLMNQLRNEKRNKSPFKINREELAGLLAEQLIQKKDELKNYEIEAGKVKFDLFKEIERIGKIIYEDYGISIL